MVVDSSVLIAVLLLEPEAEQFLNQLIDADDLQISTVSQQWLSSTKKAE